MKIELSHLSGDDPYRWLALADEYMDYHRVAATDRVIIARLHFTSDVALWFERYKVHIRSGLWTTFTKSLLQQFGSGD